MGKSETKGKSKEEREGTGGVGKQKEGRKKKVNDNTKPDAYLLCFFFSFFLTISVYRARVTGLISINKRER